MQLLLKISPCSQIKTTELLGFFSLSCSQRIKSENNGRCQLPASLCKLGSFGSESCRTAFFPPASVGLRLCTLQLTREENQQDYSSILKTHGDSCKLGI